MRGISNLSSHWQDSRHHNKTRKRKTLPEVGRDQGGMLKSLDTVERHGASLPSPLQSGPPAEAHWQDLLWCPGLASQSSGVKSDEMLPWQSDIGHQELHCSSTLAEDWLSSGFLLLVTLTVTKDVNTHQGCAGYQLTKYDTSSHTSHTLHTSHLTNLTASTPHSSQVKPWGRQPDRLTDNAAAVFIPRGYCCTKMYKSSCQVVAPVRGSARSQQEKRMATLAVLPPPASLSTLSQDRPESPAQLFQIFTITNKRNDTWSSCQGKLFFVFKDIKYLKISKIYKIAFLQFKKTNLACICINVYLYVNSCY